MIYLEYYHWMVIMIGLLPINHSIKTKEKKTTRVERGMD